MSIRTIHTCDTEKQIVRELDSFVSTFSYFVCAICDDDDDEEWWRFGGGVSFTNFPGLGVCVGGGVAIGVKAIVLDLCRIR